MFRFRATGILVFGICCLTHCSSVTRQQREKAQTPPFSVAVADGGPIATVAYLDASGTKPTKVNENSTLRRSWLMVNLASCPARRPRNRAGFRSGSSGFGSTRRKAQESTYALEKATGSYTHHSVGCTPIESLTRKNTLKKLGE